MNAKKIMASIAYLEQRLKEASPAEAAKLTKKIVALKNEWLDQ